MKPWTGWAGAFVLLGWLGLGAGQASAAWNNVFQVCCHGCRSQQSSSFFAPAPPPPTACPQISYVQRSYYQPVTTYKMETRYEPVTTYRTSYYYEPVTSVRYSSYYDPCTGCCKQVATPVTSYRLRSQCNAVQSYVQRCAMVPVTSYRISYYSEPVVTYSAPACPTCPPPCPTCTPGQPQPNVTEQPPAANPLPASPSPGVTETPGNGNGLLGPQSVPGSYKQPAPTPKAPMQMNRLASGSGRLAGQLVYEDRFTPKANATVVFVSRTNLDNRQQITTDPMGRFQTSLPPGDWWLYVSGQDGKPVFHSAVHVNPQDDRLVTVVSR
ncbi:carboxypeptidase regulatory-like domain-containing protein [Tuwongella immobilis]|uniref:Carboxypeptidase regulatory-like domain-containing protein n=1 Tax=Tuwongella immobilis TaxID=692036 RepID=A0A6C2YJ20_9BACT|nr:carboxypeptidase regulatory-like domain-containing protein [Tuwongella immobilis]VIP01281.1 unnamed protein product [Tuwongella immobilis]VTR97988.1 unnamed protein product [Tuwongella immobilis]